MRGNWVGGGGYLEIAYTRFYIEVNFLL
jgi:hypothetical protein